MPVNILIVDEQATNRILLSVKLSSAFHRVTHTADLRHALAIARNSGPDIIMISTSDPKAQCPGFVQAIRAAPQTEKTALVFVLPRNCKQLRYDAFMAGADEIIYQPLDFSYLLARFRMLLRLRNTEQELTLGNTAKALGFHEPVQAFHHPARVALLAVDNTCLHPVAARLSGDIAQDILPMSVHQEIQIAHDHQRVELFVLNVTCRMRAESLRTVAELRAAPKLRDIPLLVLLDEPDVTLAASILDMGAEEVVCDSATTAEICLRLKRLHEHKRRKDRLQNLLHSGLQAATIDPLTGLYNRRFILPHLQQLADRSAHQNRQFALMAIDLDHFKRVNDRFGHPAGDRILQQVADLLQRNTSKAGLTARLGGEEFLIALPDCTAVTARRAAHKLCDLFRTHPFRVEGAAAPLHLTISIGVIMAQGTTDVNALLNQADQALYASKAEGRNKFTFAARPAA